ncbi:MAG TPA: NAD(P)/FAD-dependent oxidoreductase [Candidatus Limnocylindrales bacterium]|nr:NAD(P)/FAD-dependent oxidoreductase [Candidatus Limnocylindrales bacterium]
MTVDVLVVGGGIAGAALATHLAQAGREVVVVERAPAYRWRAGGVFTSPAAVAALRRVGLSDHELGKVARAVPAMRVETRRGVEFRLTYGDDGSLAAPAVGLDRAGLDPLLLDRAASAGAEIRRGVSVAGVRRPAGSGGNFEVALTGPEAATRTERARVLVGADGLRSEVARSMDVARPARWANRTALTYHLADPGAALPRDARMRILRDGYVGIAPVPGGRVNVGIVLGPSWKARLHAAGAEPLASRIVRAIPSTADDPGDWRSGEPLDSVEGAAPVGQRVAAAAGPGWFLVGDAAGFLDPFTGEGIHRALVSAELAADAIDSLRAGRRHADQAADGYRQAMRARFRAKDWVSSLVQLFLGEPRLFEYAARRLAAREGPRATIGLVMGDLVPAERGLDPRFLAALLRP